MADNKRSIRSRIIALILIISSLSLLVAFAALLGYEIVSYRQTTAEQLETIGTMLAQNSTAALAFDNEEEAQDVLSSLRAEPNIICAALYDNKDSLFAKTILQPMNNEIALIVDERRLSAGLEHFEVFIPVVQENKRLGSCTSNAVQRMSCNAWCFIY